MSFRGKMLSGVIKTSREGIRDRESNSITLLFSKNNEKVPLIDFQDDLVNEVRKVLAACVNQAGLTHSKTHKWEVVSNNSQNQKEASPPSQVGFQKRREERT